MALQNQLASDMLLLKEQGICGILNLHPFTLQHYQLKKPEPKWNKSLIKYQSSTNHSKPKVDFVAEVHILNLVTHGVEAMSIMRIGLMTATGVTFVMVGIAIVHCMIACVIFLLLLSFLLWLFYKHVTPLDNLWNEKKVPGRHCLSHRAM